MRTVLVASLRTQLRRYVAALVAVTIAVAFVIVIDALGAGARTAVAAGVEKSVPDADLMVGETYGLTDQRDTDRVLAVARERGDRVAVLATTWTTVAGPDGTIGDAERVTTVSSDASLHRQQIVSGRAPISAREALVDTGLARAEGIAVGDRLTIGADGRERAFTVVGLLAPGGQLSGDVQVTWPGLAAVSDTVPDALAYSVRGGDVARALEAVDAATTSPVQPRTAYVDALVVEMNQGVDVIALMLLLFAVVAGFVAMLVITNTFAIVFAQRTRDFALLRCVGATRRQVVRSVRTEALVLALVAGATGVVAGLAAGLGLGAAIRAVAGEEVFGAVSFSPAWLAAAFLGGVLTTVAAAWFPTRVALRVSPLAALRPAEQPSARTTAGRVRLGLGLVLGIAGVGVLALAVMAASMPVLMAGGVVSFVGVLLLGPVIVPVLLRIAGRLGAGVGPVRVAAANAVRNPRRSAATTASLLVGVTLATAVLTGMASGRTAVTADMAAEYPVDFALTGTTVRTEVTDRVCGIDGVGTVVPVAGTMATTPSGRVTVVAPTDAQRHRTLDPAVLRASDTEVLVPPAVASTFEQGVPERWTLRTRTGEIELTTRLVSVSAGAAVIVSPTALDALAPRPTTEALWVLADEGVNGKELGDTLSRATRTAGLEVTDNLRDQQWVTRQLDVLVWAVLGLLGVGVVIALVGIGNTVGLSILERSREHALLRALGLTRRGLRRMLAAEGMLLALVAAVLGTVLGVAYAWCAVRAVIAPALGDAALTVPWLHLGAVIVVAGLAGLAASTLPARRGARVAPAEGLTLD